MQEAPTEALAASVTVEREGEWLLLTSIDFYT